MTCSNQFVIRTWSDRHKSSNNEFLYRTKKGCGWKRFQLPPCRSKSVRKLSGSTPDNTYSSRSGSRFVIWKKISHTKLQTDHSQWKWVLYLLSLARMITFDGYNIVRRTYRLCISLGQTCETFCRSLFMGSNKIMLAVHSCDELISNECSFIINGLWSAGHFYRQTAPIIIG